MGKLLFWGTIKTRTFSAITRRVFLSTKLRAANSSMFLSAAETNKSTGAPCSIWRCKVPDEAKLKRNLTLGCLFSIIPTDNRHYIFQTGRCRNHELDRLRRRLRLRATCQQQEYQKHPPRQRKSSHEPHLRRLRRVHTLRLIINSRLKTASNAE